MTGRDIVFDTWAWWEVLASSPDGIRLSKRYLMPSSFRIHTSALACGELVARLHGAGYPDRIPSALQAVRAHSKLHDVTPDLAEEAGHLREDLRKRHRDASLVDAVMLATTRRLGGVLVSADPAFRGLRDVVRS